MTNDLSRARTSSTANGRNNSSPVSRSAASNSSDRHSKGYSRIKSGEHKRRGVTRSPNMSYPNARAAKADLSLGSLPMTAPVKKMAVPVASVRTEPTVRTVTDTTKVSFPYSVVFLSLLCSLLFFYMIFNYVQINEHTSAVSDLKSEMKKITWFSKRDTLKSSGLVLAVLVVFAIVIGAIDWSFGQLIALLGTLY